MTKSRILVVGATGQMGRYIAKQSALLGHPTLALVRHGTSATPERVELLDSLKTLGVTLLPGTLDDHDSLISALKLADVVISTVSGSGTTDQLLLIEAMKEVGHIKRFYPSEYGHDCRHHIELAELETFKRSVIQVAEAIKAAGIPYTRIACGYMLKTSYFADDLGQFTGHYDASAKGQIHKPPREGKINIYGDAAGVFTDEDDIATYVIKSVDDPRVENKCLYIRPPKNILTHKQLVELWEQKIGHELDKNYMDKEAMYKKTKEDAFPSNIPWCVYYETFISFPHNQKFELNSEEVEATQLYPEVQYTTVDQYLSRFL